ncbi:MAG TPA: glycosyltransferase family 2 protein [Polyangiaceae bacterium]|jgi:cellulose synthase/poly-beta-1,6-N-acetylglucosamine synthase-like glycosyltransferase
MPTEPLVSVVMACSDVEGTVEGCLRSVQAQDWPRDRLEILVADGMSMDATREILAREAAGDARIHVLDNPARTQAAGLNECIREARGEFIVRVDARATYAADFVRRCVAVIERTGADTVGGPLRARGTTFFQRCVAAALRSPLGVAGAGTSARPRGEETDGWVAGAWPGAFRREVLERVGLYDPRAATDEDRDLDQRIADAGGRAYQSPEIHAETLPRESLRALGRDAFERGAGRARTLLKHKRFSALPPVLPLLGLAGEATLVATSRGRRIAPWSLAAYALATGAEAVRIARHEGPLAVPVVWAIFPAMHVSYAAGFARGLVRYLFKPDWEPAEKLARPPVEQPTHATAAR